MLFQLAFARRDEELGRTLFWADVDDLSLCQLTLAAAGAHVVDVAAVGLGAAIATDDTGQLGRLAIARIAGASTPARQGNRCSSRSCVATAHIVHNNRLYGS